MGRFFQMARPQARKKLSEVETTAAYLDIAARRNDIRIIQQRTSMRLAFAFAQPIGSRKSSFWIRSLNLEIKEV